MATGFFRNFPIVDYTFGNNTDSTLFQNLTSYIDMIDQISDNTSFYEKYVIQDGERPDTLSYKLYGTVDYYWTFYLLNEKLRVQGWPLTTQEIYSLSKEYYPNTVLVTSESMHDEFYVGDIVATRPYTDPSFKGEILEKNYDLGRIVVAPIIDVQAINLTNIGSGYTSAPTVTISGGGGEGAIAQAVLDGDSVDEIIILNGGKNYTSAPTITLSEPQIASGTRATATATLSNPSVSRNTVVYSFKNQKDTRLWEVDAVDERSLYVNKVELQYESVHHYEDADGNWLDVPIDTDGGGVQNYGPGIVGKTPITHLDRLISQNEDLSSIKILKPEVANQINIEFQKLLKRI